MIHLLPHWNVESFGEPVRVWAYTNCPEAELFLNGVSLGRRAVEPYGHAEWLVEYEAGRLEAVGYGADGQAVTSDVKETTGAPVALRLRLENEVKTVADVAIVTCYAVDGEGRTVPDACPTVEFSTNELGRILGTGSDVCDHTPLNSPVRKMREGAIGVAVGVSSLKGAILQRSGVVELYAKAEGLRGAKLTYTLEE